MTIPAGLAVFFVFLILRLTHVTNWNWWWVTAPLWIGVVLSFVVFFVFGLAAKAVNRFVDR